MDIIRTSSRYKEFEKTPEVSDWYKDKIMPFYHLDLPDSLEQDGHRWIKTQWGYVREDYINDGDACRGQVTLAVASDNISSMSFRNWRHVYDLRRPLTHAAPELQDKVEQVRDELKAKCGPLGEYLGKIWVETKGGHYAEANNVISVCKDDLTTEELLKLVNK